MKTTDIDIFITPTEVAEIFKVTVQGLYKHLKDQGIMTIRDNGRHKIYPHEMRKLLEAKGLPIPREIVALHIVKGGVGKTTLVHGLGSRASAFGLKTLLIDLDQQANLTTSFGIYSEPRKHPTLIDVINGAFNNKRITVKDTIVPIADYLHIIPSNLTIANLDLQLIHGNENIAKFFKDLFEPIRNDYDLIFVDCPPSLSRVTSAAHCFANRIVMPVNTDRFSIDGLELTLDHLTGLQKKFGIDPILNIVINKFDARQKILGNAVIQALTSRYRDYLLESYISISKQIDNSIAAHKCIWAEKPSKNQALQDINNLLIELFDLEAWSNFKRPTSKTLHQEELSNV